MYIASHSMIAGVHMHVYCKTESTFTTRHNSEVSVNT